MVMNQANYRYGLLIMLLLVLSSNFALYHTAFGINMLPEQPNSVVVGSILDLALISPILFILWKRSWSWKNMILAIAGGLVLIRFLIPMEYLEPFQAVTWIGFGVEGLIFLAEIYLIMTAAKNLPAIIRLVKNSPLPVVFSVTDAFEKQMKPSRLLSVICFDILTLYYAFASWRKKPQADSRTFTLHRNSSLIAFQVMMIHAIIIETVGIHWWLHEKLFVVSVILLIMNIYTVIFFLGDIQAVRLNPMQVTEEGIYISLGLAKRMKINWTDISEWVDDPEILNQKASKNTIEFIARDFEDVRPNIIIRFKHPLKASLFAGIKKEFQQAAIRVDDPVRFKKIIKTDAPID